MDTLKLDTDTWDLTVDASGNIAVATGPEAIAQDVASSVRLFSGELWYDTTQGVPYLQQILGKLPSAQFMKTQFIAAGMGVPGVVSIKCFLTGLDPKRGIGGQLQITDNTGALSVAQSGALQDALPWYIAAVSPRAAA